MQLKPHTVPGTIHTTIETPHDFYLLECCCCALELMLMGLMGLLGGLMGPLRGLAPTYKYVSSWSQTFHPCISLVSTWPWRHPLKFAQPRAVHAKTGSTCAANLAAALQTSSEAAWARAPQNSRCNWVCCHRCKTDDMTNVGSTPRKCFCGRAQPNFAHRGQQKPTHCAKCKEPGMVNIRASTCACGKAVPSFGIQGKHIALA